MSGPSDKARFYLERAVPQLQEFKEKKMFTEHEIRTLVKKRSDFEHKVLGRGSQPVDFAKYAAWEISLEHLRQKRCQRLRIKDSTSFSGQARIFSIFDRATKKHPGDVALWMSYLECAREAKAMKKFKEVWTAAIRLHPTKSELWLYAAKWALQTEADMNGARSYMQRGTRFCTTNKELWIEYAKLEMIYLAKIAMRRRILGLDVDNKMDTDETVEGNDAEDSGEFMAFPDFDEPKDKPNTLKLGMIKGVSVESEATKDPMSTPALNGAIPMAIFDASRKQPFFCPTAAEGFFKMFASFKQVKCSTAILQHVLDCMFETFPADPCTSNCYVRQPLMGLPPTSPEFPAALGIALERLKETEAVSKDKNELAKKTKIWAEKILKVDDLDPDIKLVLGHTLRKLGA
ncbi:U3 small nucleolar RNA-associated protein 6-domain-containing protein [Amylocarpus encephaloides]|uniref:U3 small nucleolar RNA-associated protein 6-domain-containing protein n=1 Tax=Amylocarpus encephaloides TaxID=45428 RepID=A0A9P7YE20_9HELO|nr:U3 small nucleolar RNA-associated protein 6-domain-containing protein [Amylocarpus encephaloides]